MRKKGNYILLAAILICLIQPVNAQEDCKESVWLENANRGNAAAQYLVALCWDDQENYSESAAWYRKSAEQGYGDAQLYLGLMYDNGQGVTQDYKEAMKWYTLAAEQGIASAQYNLGLMYDNGQGVIQDYKEAMKWYTLAAEQGHASAQTNLGFMYGNGQGVTQDYSQAHKWYNLGGSNGSELGAKNRDIIAKKMTPSQIEKAQDLARKFQPTK
jgi:TPR repeat protein